MRRQHARVFAHGAEPRVRDRRRQPLVVVLLVDEGALDLRAEVDSQEICFVPNGDYAAFLDAYLRKQGEAAPAVEGELVSTDGRVLARHSGVHHFTVGQRKGLGVAAGEPLYVIATDPATQRVTVGKNEDLLRGEFAVKDVNWISIAEPESPVRAEVRIRNKHVPAAATVRAIEGGRAEVRFDEPQRAVTPGQAAVFYSGNLVLGGGWIE